MEEVVRLAERDGEVENVTMPKFRREKGGGRRTPIFSAGSLDDFTGGRGQTRLFIRRDKA